MLVNGTHDLRRKTKRLYDEESQGIRSRLYRKR